MAMELGDQLRHAREARGFSLDDLSALTKIPVRTLQALEAEAFDRLPPGIFRRAHLRTFAGAVGLDAEECVHAYTDRWEPPPPPETEPRLSSWSDNRLRALLAIIIIAGGFAVLPLVAAMWRATAPTGPDTQTRTSAPAPQAPSAAAAAETSPPTPTPVIAPRALRVQIRAIERCWISATADEARAVRRLVRPGETVTIDAATAIVLHLGNAGAVTYTINGARGRPLGRRGKLVTVRITPSSYSSLLAEARSSS